MSSRRLALALCLAGTIFAVFVAFFKQQAPTSSGWWFPVVFVVGPWLALDVLFAWWKSSRGIVAAGVLLLALELYIFYGVFIDPRSSTDALAYVSKPAIQLFVLLPLGLLMGWIGDKLAAASTVVLHLANSVEPRSFLTITWKWLVVGAAIGAAIIAAPIYFRGQIAIDSCLDLGGRWNYERDVCDR